MARLYRPHIPFSVKIAVAERQLRQIDERSRMRHPSPSKSWTLKHQLSFLLDVLSESMMCEREELRLDHDPPLGARPRRRRGLGRKTYYTPDANDPDHLFYRPHGPEHAGSHLIKTNVRGDHGQHPDRVLIKKARRRERSREGETRRKTSKFPNRAARVKRVTGVAGATILRKTRKWDHPGKRDWPKRSFPSRRKP